MSEYLKTKIVQIIELATESLYTPYNGVNTGILAILDPMPQTVRFSSLHFSGFKVIINDPTEYPGSQSTTKMVSLGNIAFLHLFGSKMTCSDAVQLLPISHRDCVFSEEHQLDSFKEYSDSSCLTECEAKYFYKICKCVPYYYNFLKKLECTASQLACLLTVRKSVYVWAYAQADESLVVKRYGWDVGGYDEVNLVRIRLAQLPYLLTTSPRCPNVPCTYA
ncbi:unnamed protein product [Diabrotica balteata]|uniref:Uncharacterized protein n=1 Tax=Diabrotica balteata TaxID=107213 RepID=A0A9N9XCZ9_DIABA|nr:unnamed protein product [Diabrotica balteata]